MPNTSIKRLQMPNGDVYDIHAFKADKLGNYDATDYALKSDVADVIAKGVTFKGPFTSAYTPQAYTGNMYVVVANNTTINGITCDIGDMWICSAQPQEGQTYGVVNAASASSSQTELNTINNSWTIVQANIDRQQLDEDYASSSHTHNFTANSKTDDHSAPTHAANDAEITATGSTSTHDHTFTGTAHTHANSTFTNDVTAIAEVPAVKYDKLTGLTFTALQPEATTQSATLAGTLDDGSHTHTITATLADTKPSGRVGLDHKHENVSLEGKATVPKNSFSHTHTVQTTTIAVPTADSFELTGAISTTDNTTLILSITHSSSEDTEITYATSVDTGDVNSEAVELEVAVSGDITNTALATVTTALTRALEMDELKNVKVNAEATATVHSHDLTKDTASIVLSLGFGSLTPEVATDGFGYTSTVASEAKSATVKFTEGNNDASTILKPALHITDYAATGTISAVATAVTAKFDAKNITIDLTHHHTLGAAGIGTPQETNT